MPLDLYLDFVQVANLEKCPNGWVEHGVLSIHPRFLEKVSTRLRPLGEVFFIRLWSNVVPNWESGIHIAEDGIHVVVEDGIHAFVDTVYGYK